MEIACNINDLTIKELTQGLKRTETKISCISCGTIFDIGRIYEVHGELITAERAADEHVTSEHGGVLRMLSQFPKENTGLSDVQRDLIAQLSERKSDREIARNSHRSESTIRNQRFQLRRKISEAKVMCAIGMLLEQLKDEDAEFVTYHPDIPSADDRIMTTYAEEREIIRRYFESIENLKLERFPKKQKEKLVVLKQISGKFEPERDYSEREVNEILQPIYVDYVTIRRYLIEYRFLDRERGGAKYWLHANQTQS